MARVAWAAAAAWLAACACAPAAAHPHGALSCSLRADAAGGGLRGVDVELRFDAPHSAQAAEAVRAAPDAAPDPLRMARFTQGLTLQMARWNWMVDVRQGEQPIPLRPGFPQLAWSGEHLLVRVRLEAEPAAAPAAGEWALRCADPTYYWTTSIEQAAVVPATGACTVLRRTAPHEVRWTCDDQG